MLEAQHGHSETRYAGENRWAHHGKPPREKNDKDKHLVPAVRERAPPQTNARVQDPPKNQYRRRRAEECWIVEQEHQRHRVSRASKVERRNTAAVSNACDETYERVPPLRPTQPEQVHRRPTECEGDNQDYSKSGLAARNQGGSNRAKSRRRGAANRRQKLRIE
ncbi:hypothetical protein BDN67DRAFT_983899 [Paxillus ammoniavirescens]|nr:hypothetical protein BDN67DRAFT_983899 [Paxillus ammoniavirescens]